jgi:hypothetical protein
LPFDCGSPNGITSISAPGGPGAFNLRKLPGPRRTGGIVIDIVRTELWMGMHALKGLRINAYQVGPSLCSLGHDSGSFPRPPARPPSGLPRIPGSARSAATTA